MPYASCPTAIVNAPVEVVCAASTRRRRQGYQKPNIHGQILVVPAAEGIAVTGLHKPAVLRRDPEHEVKNGNRAERIGGRPLPARANHEFHVLAELERFLENHFGFPFRTILASQWRDTGLDFEPMLDRRHLDRNAGPKAWFAILETPFPPPAKLKHTPPVVFPRTFPGQNWPGNSY